MWPWLLACSPEPRVWVEPFDGSSAVAPQDPVRAVLEGVDYPDGEAVPDDVITVVDLDRGGLVAGVTRFEDERVTFVPDAPWREGGTYGWAVTAPAPVTRRPLLEVPAAAWGEASFRVGGAPVLLDAALDDDGALCLLFSAPVPWLADLEVDGAPVSDTDGEPLRLPAPRPAGESPARCAPISARVGDLVRYTGADGTTSAARVSSRPLRAAWRERHRWGAP